MRALIAVLLLCSHLTAADWFASPTGTAQGLGTRAEPWDLTTAAMNIGDIKAGDTLYLEAGTYKHPDRSPGTYGYQVSLVGQRGYEVTIRPVDGARATIDGGLHTVNAKHVTFRDLEVICSEVVGDDERESGTFSSPAGGINVENSCDAIHIINCVIHDNMHGIGHWQDVGDSVVYGNVIYNNGWSAPDRKHGHGIYAQHKEEQWKEISDNVFINNWSHSVHIYGSSAAHANRMMVDRNITAKGEHSDSGRFLLGVGSPSTSCYARDNTVYGASLDWGTVAGSSDGIFVRNIVRGRMYNCSAAIWSPLVRHDNIGWHFDWSQPRYDYVSGPPPTDATIRLWVNRYDRDRANLVVMNWPGDATTDVALSGLLDDGDTYEIYDPRDLYGQPIYQGTYAGPVTLTTPNEFQSYVVFKTGTTGPPVPPADEWTDIPPGSTKAKIEFQ